MGQKVALEAPTSNYGIAAYVDKTVTVYGYLTSVHVEEGAEAESYTMVVNNAVPVSFKENATWSLSYENDPTAEYPEIVTNTVSGSSVPYQLALYSEEYYLELGGTPEAAALMLCDDLQYYYWQFNYQYGFTQELLYSILVHSGETDSEGFNEVDYGKYYILAVGTNQDGTVTGDYKVQEIEKKEPKSVASYSDFLGKWILGDDLISITEKTTGSTYNVTGIKNQDGIPAFEAEFVDGKFILKEQKSSGTWDNPNYGICDLYLSAIYSSSYGSSTAYPFDTEEPATIFTGYILEDAPDVVTLKAGSCKGGPFVAAAISWVIQSGENAGRGNTWSGTTISPTMNKYVDNIPDELLGNWICPEKADLWGEDTYTDWTITIEKSGIGVAMKGFDAGMDAVCDANSLARVYPIAQYDPETKTLTVPDNTATGISSGGVSINWRGISGEYYSDIVFNVDFESKTLSLAVDVFVARNSSGAFSAFEAPLVFTKEGTEPAAVPAVKASSHSSKIKSQVKTSKKVSMQKSTVAAKFNAPVSRKIDPRVEKSGKASAIKLVK